MANGPLLTTSTCEYQRNQCAQAMASQPWVSGRSPVRERHLGLTTLRELQHVVDEITDVNVSLDLEGATILGEARTNPSCKTLNVSALLTF